MVNGGIKNIVEIDTSEITTRSQQHGSKGYVTLPVCEEEFKDFIRGILGESQTIEGVFTGTFDISIEEIQNIFYLIQQRVEQQNKASLIQFVTKIMYNNNTSITINSFDELKTYNEIRPIIPVSIHLSWIYLIQFQDKNIPEKQEIEISIVRNKIRRQTINANSMITMYAGDAYIQYRVKHTARTWGIDIEALLTNHIKNIIVEPGKIKKFLLRKSDSLGVIMSLLVFGASILGTILGANAFSAKTMARVNIYLNSKPLSVGDKINFISQYIAKGEWFKFNNSVVLFIVTMLIVSIVSGVWVSSALEIMEPSFITITKEATKFRDKEIKKLCRNWRMFFASIIGSIFVGVMGNYVFYILQNR